MELFYRNNKVYPAVKVNGFTPTGSISITENGTYDVTDKAQAVVNVGGGTVSSVLYEKTISLDDFTKPGRFNTFIDTEKIVTDVALEDTVILTIGSYGFAKAQYFEVSYFNGTLGTGYQDAFIKFYSDKTEVTYNDDFLAIAYLSDYIYLKVEKVTSLIDEEIGYSEWQMVDDYNAVATINQVLTDSLSVGDSIVYFISGGSLDYCCKLKVKQIDGQLCAIQDNVVTIEFNNTGTIITQAMSQIRTMHIFIAKSED